MSICLVVLSTRRLPVGLAPLACLVFLSVVPLVPTGHAHSQGIVCIVPRGSTSCPASEATITGSKGSTLMIDVFINGSDLLNGFQVNIKADHNILQPLDANTTFGTVLFGTPVVIHKCIGGSQPPGIIQVCDPQDTIDTIDLALASNPTTPAPVTGLLFTAWYKVTGSDSSAPINFQTGCGSPTSVSGGVCVTISNGSFSPVPETAQGATFLTLQTQTLTTSFNGVAFTVTSSLANDTRNSRLIGTIKVTATNNTNGQIFLTKDFSVNVTFPGKNQIIPPRP